MSNKFTPVETAERVEFVLSRLRKGFSFTEVNKQFSKQYGIEISAARKWVNRACKDVALDTGVRARKRTHSVIVEIYHDVIVAFQKDLVAIQLEIDSLDRAEKERETVFAAIRNSSNPNDISKFLKMLEEIPFVKPTEKAQIIESKSRIRERMFRVMSDLARLHGFTGTSNDWRSALSVMIDNNLLPAPICDQILKVMDEFEANVRSIGKSKMKLEQEDILTSEDREFEIDD